MPLEITSNIDLTEKIDILKKYQFVTSTFIKNSIPKLKANNFKDMHDAIVNLIAKIDSKYFRTNRTNVNRYILAYFNEIETIPGLTSLISLKHINLFLTESQLVKFLEKIKPEIDQGIAIIYPYKMETPIQRYHNKRKPILLEEIEDFTKLLDIIIASKSIQQELFTAASIDDMPLMANAIKQQTDISVNAYKPLSKIKNLIN